MGYDFIEFDGGMDVSFFSLIMPPIAPPNAPNNVLGNIKKPKKYEG
ncbi:MAG: hypothetical protein ACFFD7_12405 [Candidatus Thorarchaeota archaeon]